MTDRISALKSLHTRLIDSRDGYRDALGQIEDPAIRSTLQQLLDRRERNASELRAKLVGIGEHVDDDGSILAAAHRQFMDLKDRLTGTDDGAVLAELVRGENILLDAYDDALTEAGGRDPEFAFLAEQHRSLKTAISQLETRKAIAA